MMKDKIVILIFIITISLIGCKAEIQHGLSEQEANEIVTFLRNIGIEAEKEVEGGTSKEKTWKIIVPQADSTKALNILYEYNLPRRKKDSLATVFSGTSLVPTPTEERALLLRAISGELSKSIENIDGVIYAQVHFVLPEEKEFSEESSQEQTKASVLIKYIGESPPYNPEDIKKLVAGAIPKLKPENVTVIGVKRSPIIPLTQQEPLVTIAGIKITKSSKFILQLILGILIGMITILSIIIVILAWQLKKVKKYQSE